MPLILEFYRSGVSKRWRWRVIARNGRKIGSSSQALGYKHLYDAEEAAALVLTGGRGVVRADTVLERPDVEVRRP